MADLAPLDRLKAALAERYRIERVLGSGGMATVYLARDLRHDRDVALKVLRPELSAAVGTKRFLAEIRITAALDHPHILTLIDSGETAGFLWYVLPYVRGESLRERLQRDQQLPLGDALTIVRQIAGALDHAHRQGVLHRDIKPENILLFEGEAMLADFGIALAVDTAAELRLTKTGTSLGTPEYMSPEQATAARQLDARSDVYSLGAVAYEMLAGEPPHSGHSAQAVMARLLTERPTALRTLRAAVPASVDEAIATALAKTPADRHASAGAFAAALVTEKPAGRRRVTRYIVLAGLAVAAVIGGRLLLQRSPALGPGIEEAFPRTAIAVLPFQTLSADTANAYLAVGLHDELLTQLSKVAALSLRGRASVRGYAGTKKPVTQIADELRVGTLLDGSVQVIGSRLRVNVTLIDAATDESLWAESYDRTLDDAFAIQSEVAQHVVVAVGVALGSTEQRAVMDAPTANPEAYRLYLQGLHYHLRPGWHQRDLESAQRLYEQAIARDPQFALAYAELSLVHGVMHWFRRDPSPARVEAQREAAQAALRLAPELPQAHMAMGQWHYWGRGAYAAALAEFEIASRGLPNDARLVHLIGTVHRRLGDWNEALRAFQRTAELDPRNANALVDLGGFTYEVLRRYSDAVHTYGRAFALAPDFPEAELYRSRALFRWQGQLDTLRYVLDKLPATAAHSWRADLLLWERRPDSLLTLLASVRWPVFDGARWYYLPTSLYSGWAHQLRGDAVAARLAFDSARAMLDSVALTLPRDWRVRAARGLAFAGLGLREDALREVRWLQEFSTDEYEALVVAEHRAMILAQMGEAEAALDEVERLLAGPSYLSVSMLRHDPRWDLIRDHARFKGLLARSARSPRRRRRRAA